MNIEAYKSVVAEQDYIPTWKDFAGIEPIPGTEVESDIEDDEKQPEGLEETVIRNTATQNRKVLRDGQLLILHGDRTYTAQGIWVK